MLKLDYDAVHRFVEGYEHARWDGWDVLLWNETPSGATRQNGAFVNGKWGIQRRISPNAEGKWVLRV